MTEQNQRIHSDNQPNDAPILTSGHKLIKRKFCQLQNKAYFFEGQLNPLVGQNQKLKAQLTLLNKSVIASTDLLRSLLPIGSSQSKRLKLELANIEEISEMIREDWYMMEDQIQRKTFAIGVLENKMLSNKEEYEKEFTTYKRDTQLIINGKNGIIESLQESKNKLQTELQMTKLKYEKQISDVKDLFKSKVQHIQKLQKEFTLYSRQVQGKYRDFEKNIERLKIQIASNLNQFEESKKNLREIYDKLMSEKLQEQAEGFNSLLRVKEQEKERLIAQYYEKEQYMQNYLNQKTVEIEQLRIQSQKQTEELQKRQNQINELQKTTKQMQEHAQNKEKQLQTLKSNKQLTEQRLKHKELQMIEKQRIYQQQLNQQNKNRSLLQQELNSRIAKLQQNYSKLNEELVEKTQALKQLEKSLATAERRFARKLQEEQSKWAVEKHLLEEQSKQLSALLQQKQTLMSQLSLKYQQQIKDQQEKMSKQLNFLKQSYQKQINLLNSSTSQQLAIIKKQKQRILSQQRIKNNKQMLQYQQQVNTKMRLKQQQFNNLKANLQEQIMQTLLQLKQKELLIQELQTSKKLSEKLLQQTKVKHQLQLRHVKEESLKAMKQLQKQCEMQKKKIQQQMVNQLMEFQIQMEKKSAQYQSTLEKIQNEMMKEINMLKSSNALQELQAKYLNQMASLKNQHQQQLICMEEKQKQSQQSLIQQQKRHIQRLILQYEQDMTRLAKKLQSDIENLNSELFDEQHQHEITKMTRQQKIMYLSKKINQLKFISEKKQNQILQLQLEIQEYKKQQAKIKEIIDQRVNQRRAELDIQKDEFMRQCQVNVDKNRLEAQRKVTQAQRDRIEHSQSMFEKFNQLKQLHQAQISRIQKRYSELQKLFSQRPSRAEDLSKIKELIEIKEKLNLEMKTYHKKVEHANEIVKYLNLELENYKDSYDMFGPNDDQSDKPIVIENSSCENPIQSIMKLKKINYRINTQGSQIAYSSQKKYETATPKLHNLRISNDSPSFREFQLYPGTKLNESQSLIPPEASSQSKIPYNRKSPEAMVNNRIRKARSIDKSGEIVLNAENFLKLINDNSRNGPAIRDNKSNERRAYRKSKPRRLNTLGMGNGQMYSLARRQSIDQESQLK